MTACVNDWTPVITILAIQVPILVGVIATWFTTKINAEKSHSNADLVQGKVDSLTTLVIDGFKSPPTKPPENTPN